MKTMVSVILFWKHVILSFVWKQEMMMSLIGLLWRMAFWWNTSVYLQLIWSYQGAFCMLRIQDTSRPYWSPSSSSQHCMVKVYYSSKQNPYSLQFLNTEFWHHSRMPHCITVWSQHKAGNCFNGMSVAFLFPAFRKENVSLK